MIQVGYVLGAPLPIDVRKLGHYLGPSIDIGSVKTTKIFTQNGQVLQRSKYRPLTTDEIADKTRSDAQEQLMARVH